MRTGVASAVLASPTSALRQALQRVEFSAGQGRPIAAAAATVSLCWRRRPRTASATASPGRGALSAATLRVVFTLVDVLLAAVGVVFATAVARCGLRVQVVVEPSRERSLYPGLRQTLSREVCLDL